MNRILLSLVLLFAVCASQAQTQRTLSLRAIGEDSVNFSYDDKYFLTEDNCAQIVRYGHFNFRKLKFLGKFKDINKQYPDIIVTEGEYNSDGLKNGYFTTRYINGNLLAKGLFKDGKYDGKWEVYYADGKPQLLFEVNNGVTTVTDAWDTNGKKVVENGKGKYRVTFEFGLNWEGKLLDGKPDGTWTLSNSMLNTNTLMTETHKNGQFVKGRSGFGTVFTASQIMLVDTLMLPFTKGEQMATSRTPCTGSGNGITFPAKYAEGNDAFTSIIKENISHYLSRVDITPYNNSEVNIEAEVADDGTIGEFKGTTSVDKNLTTNIINQLRKLPKLQPATLNGQPIKSSFKINFTFSRGSYNFTYRFAPIFVVVKEY